MTLTLFALFVLPFHLALVVAPEQFKRTVQKLASMNNDHIFVGLSMMLLSLSIFATRGFSFKLRWEDLIFFIALAVWLKGMVWVFWPSLPLKKLNWFSIGVLPALGFFGMLFDLALIYIDLKFA